MDPGATSKLFLRWDRPWWRDLARCVVWLCAGETTPFDESSNHLLANVALSRRHFTTMYKCLLFALVVNRRSSGSPSPGPQMSSNTGAEMIGRRASTASTKSRVIRTCSWRGSPVHRRGRWIACQTMRNENSAKYNLLNFINSFWQVSKKIGKVLRAFIGDDSLPLPAEIIRHKWTEVSMSPRNIYIKYRVTHHVVQNLPLTSKQKFHFGLAWPGFIQT